MLLLWSRKRVMSVLIYVFEGRMVFYFIFPLLKLMLSLKLNAENAQLWKFLFPNYFFLLILPDGCLGLTSWLLAWTCQSCLHMSVPKCLPVGQVVWAGARQQELGPHGAQCPLQVSLALAAPGHSPLPSFLLPGGSQTFLIPLTWCWQGPFAEVFMQGLAVISFRLQFILSVPKWFCDSPWMTITWVKKKRVFG